MELNGANVLIRAGSGGSAGPRGRRLLARRLASHRPLGVILAFDAATALHIPLG